jgi:gliding motility-associated-like protein
MSPQSKLQYIKILSVIVLLFIYCIKGAKAQDYNVWMYDRVGMDFNTEPPTFYNNTDAAGGIATSSISDEKGSLLYYGAESWRWTYYAILNKNLDSILPSTKNWLYGAEDRYFSFFIRSNDSIYYFFYNANISNPDKGSGLFYTQINRNLNGGNGGIVPFQKDVKIYPLACAGMGATMNADSSWWITTRSYDSLVAFKVTKNGLQGSYSSYAPENLFPQLYPTPLNNPTQLGMRFSHDGKFLVCFSSYYYALSKSGYFDQTYFYTYNFDKISGKFSNQKLIDQDSTSKGIYYSYTDAEFSPNDSLLYVVSSNKEDCVIEQYERFAPNFKASKECVYSFADLLADTSYVVSTNSMQLGQNGRIYLGGTGGLNYSIIYKPNNKGKACMLLSNSTYKIKCSLTPNGNGCPQADFPFSRYHGLKMDFAPQPQCDSTIKMANLCDKSKFVSYRWYIYATDNSSYKDSAVGESPVFSPPSEGKYWVKLRAFTPKGYGPWYSDTIEFKYLTLPKAGFYAKTNLGCRYVNFELTDSSKQGMVNMNPKSWHWFFGDGKDTTIIDNNSGTVFHSYSQTGNYSIKLVYNDGFCTDSNIKNSLVSIKEAPRPGIAITDTLGCQPFSTTVSRKYIDTITSIVYNLGNGKGEINPPLINSVDAAPIDVDYSTSGRYLIKQTLTGGTGCVTYDSVWVTVLQGFDAGQIPVLVYSTVENETFTRTVWDSLPNAIAYNLFRSTDKINWKNIAAFNPFATRKFIDSSNVEVAKQQYYYKIVAKDTCNASVESNLGSTILLQGKNYDNEFSIIEWTPYESWTMGIKEYAVETKNSLGLWSSIGNTSTLAYTDNNYGADEKSFEQCYRIVAYSNDGIASSTSNSVCLPYQPVMWVPNGFSPNNDQRNDVFKITSLGIEKINVSIFDRYGELIYYCEGLDCEWGGTFNNAPCPIGAYTYIINAQSTEKKNINTSGTVTLLR